MRGNYKVNSGTRFRMLSDDQLEELLGGVLHLLEYTGLEVHHEESLEILKKAGAWVDGKRVRIPSYLVRKSLELAPRSFTIFSRDGNSENDIIIGPGRAHFGPGPTCPNFIDIESMDRRPYVKSDVPNVAKMVDALPNIDFCESLGTVDDVHHDLGALYEFAGMFPNTSKPIVAWSYDKDDSAGIHEIAIAEAGGQDAFEKRPNYVHYCEPLSPLISTGEALDKLIFAATNRIPLIFTPCPIAGGTAPVTAAGIITQGAAESWMGLVIAQAIQPGLPFFMGGVFSVMDMSAMILSYGAPELSLMMAGLTDLAHYVGLPLWQTGGCTDSKTFDEQAIIEGSLSVFFSALSGGDMTHDVGYTESAMTGSVFQLCAMDEAIGYSRRITHGIEVTEETLAVKVIDNVGPNGHYLREQHTRDHYKTEYWYPNLCNRRNYEEWEEDGKKTMKDRTVARVHEILATHKPTPIKPETEEVIKKVLAEAEERVKED
ncbi:MAG: trimethylamine methyltransferase [Anaerolineae bacterium]|jgi:trimethylamine---corrinoid protein Co-methyltransferase|nr:trimethylamine methyltransferase [Anaerolineae bacterium]MBT7189204.1 trimethylamine methyltransferase [Anaerolineae bacterium]MBT7991131.1 trimethylamine methyltransferase [Anaerolineae bacterium]